jgi:membrane associated rhomboid family serine protease
MKKFFKLPFGVSMLLLVNLGMFLVFLLIETFLNVNLTTYFSANITSSNYFNPIQVFTFMFVHSNYDFSHITSNLLILVFFGITLEKMIGYKNMIALYLFSGLCSFLFFNVRKEMEKKVFNKVCIENNIYLNKLPQYKSGEYELNDYFISLDNRQHSILKKFNSVNGIFLGSSGSVAGVIVLYVLTHFFYFKNIFKVLVGAFFITIFILDISKCTFESSGTTYGHLGGMLGGFIYLIPYLYTKHKKRST